MSEPQIIWGVEVGEYSAAYIAQTFTTEALAEHYAEENDGEVVALPLYNRPIRTIPLHVRIAEVYPDREVKRFERVEDCDEPGPAPVQENSPAFNGHLQEHCGFHVYVSGGGKRKVEEEFEQQIAGALKRCNGTCPSCLRTENYTTGPWQRDSVKVRLVGGPHDGQVNEEEMPRGRNIGEYHPGGGVLVCLHGTADEQFNTSYVGPEWDEETGEWIRRVGETWGVTP